MIQKNNIFIFLFFLAISLSISSCYTHEEGCKDVNAINFDVTVDEPCEDECCTYPKVNLYVNFLFNDTIRIDTNTYFTNNLGDSLRIQFLRLYLSDFKLTTNKDEDILLKQEITIGRNENDNINYENINYSSAKVKPEGSKYTIGTLNKLLEYKKVEFQFGLDSIINHSVIDRISASSSLFPSTDSMYIDQELGYYFLKMEIEIKNKKTRKIFVSGIENIKSIIITNNIDFTKREDHNLTVNIDLNKWFLDIDFTNETSNQLSQKLVNNLNGSFKL